MLEHKFLGLRKPSPRHVLVCWAGATNSKAKPKAKPPPPSAISHQQSTYLIWKAARNESFCFFLRCVKFTFRLIISNISSGSLWHKIWGISRTRNQFFRPIFLLALGLFPAGLASERPLNEWQPSVGKAHFIVAFVTFFIFSLSVWRRVHWLCIIYAFARAALKTIYTVAINPGPVVSQSR